MVGTPAADVTWRVSIIATDFAIRGVPIDHRVHVASCHAEKQIRLAQDFEGLRALPVRLRNDADPESLILEHPPDDGHAKARVIDIRVTRNDDDVTAVPAELSHFIAAHRQKRCDTEPRRPELAVAVQRLGIAREEGNIGVGSHTNSKVAPQSLPRI